MGMYDLVDWEQDCPRCGAKIRHFQTKEKAQQMETYKPHEVDNFYSYCGYCGLWVNYTVHQWLANTRLDMESCLKDWILK